MGGVNLGDRLTWQRGQGNTGVVAIFAIAVIVILVLVVYWGFLAPGHFFGPSQSPGGTININVSHTP
jgi:hypothetical protein